MRVQEQEKLKELDRYHGGDDDADADGGDGGGGAADEAEEQEKVTGQSHYHCYHEGSVARWMKVGPALPYQIQCYSSQDYEVP